MNAINAYTQIFDDFKGQDVLKKIEACGRVCYKSEKKIEEGSAEKFVSNIIKRGHESVLEHGSFIFEVSNEFYNATKYVTHELEEMGEFVSFLRFTDETKPIVSGNVRAWRDFFRVVLKCYSHLPDASKKFIKCNPTIFPEFQNVEFCGADDDFKPLKVSDLKTENEKLTHWDVTVKFIVDRGISHELVRHRVASPSQESTRYCNYSKDDFGSEVTFIIPFYLDYKSSGWNTWKDAMKACESAYFKLLDIGLTAQEARAVLPNSLKTEVVMTQSLKYWKHFFILRTPNAAHPQMTEVSRPLLEEFKTIIPGIPKAFNEITY